MQGDDIRPSQPEDARHLRMRAFAARERVEARILTSSFIRGSCKWPDVGSKPLGGQKLLGLLGLVNVRVPEEDASSMAAKTVGRIGAVGSRSDPLTPAAAGIAVVASACLPRAAAQPSYQFQDR